MKTCPHCGAQHNKTRDTHCSRACYLAARTAAAAVKNAAVGPCQACGKNLIQYPGERNDTFRRRKHCDDTCKETIRVKRKAAADERRRLRNAAKRNDLETGRIRARAYRAAKRAAAPRPKVSRFTTNATHLDEASITMERHETIHMIVLGEPCPTHPGEKIGVFGCPACRSGENWRREQHQLRGRPQAGALIKPN